MYTANLMMADIVEMQENAQKWHQQAHPSDG
jgi:hypothetical protein